MSFLMSLPSSRDVILNQNLAFLASSLHRAVTKPSMRCLTMEKVESESLQRRKGSKM